MQPVESAPETAASNPPDTGKVQAPALANDDKLGWAAVGIFVLALGVRLIHLWQIRRAPFIGMVMGDAQVYDTWARKIAAGDWLGQNVFYHAPLYPYFLSLIYIVGKGSLMAARLCQAVLGAASCVLLAKAGCRFFSKSTGIAAGLLLACYAPAIFFDGVIHKSTLDIFFICLLLWLFGEVVVSPRASLWCYLGLTMGGLILTRENALVLVPAIFLWVLVHYRRQRRQIVVFGGLFLAALAVLLLPVALRNQIMGGEFHLTTHFGHNLYIGNNEQADGSYKPLRPGRADPRYERQDATELAEQALGKSLTPGEVSLYWTKRALAFITSHPGQWLRLMGRKLALVCNKVEIIDTEDHYIYADWSLPLRVADSVDHWGVILPLALLGFWVSWPNRSKLQVVYLLMATYLASLMLFCVVARYRHPLAPFLVLFAAAALVGIRRFWLDAPLWRVRAGLATALVMVVVGEWRLVSKPTMRASMLSNMAAISQSQGQFQDAVRYCRQALQIDPALMEAWNNLGIAQAELNQTKEAVESFQRALQLDPNYLTARLNLNRALAAAGKQDNAIEGYR